MSTKSSIVFHCPDEKKCNHKLRIHSFKDMHQVEGTICFQFWCSTCHCTYEFLMDEHLGEQLNEILRRGIR